MLLKVGHHWSASETPFKLNVFRWHSDNGPPLNAGSIALWFLGYG